MCIQIPKGWFFSSGRSVSVGETFRHLDARYLCLKVITWHQLSCSKNATETILNVHLWRNYQITLNSSDSITYGTVILSRPHSESLCLPFFHYPSVDSLLFLNKLLIYKLWCWSLSEKLWELSLSQGLSAFTICLFSGSVSFIWNFLLKFLALSSRGF